MWTLSSLSYPGKKGSPWEEFLLYVSYDYGMLENDTSVAAVIESTHINTEYKYLIGNNKTKKT
jgi:hypothetical protein